VGRSALVSFGALVILSSVVAAGSMAKDRPVMKVVRILKDMKQELETEMDEDSNLHDKYMCWCETNLKDTTSAIEAGKTNSEQLQSEIDKIAAKLSEHEAKHNILVKDLAADQTALVEATALRKREGNAFQIEEASLLSAIGACKQAVTTLTQDKLDSIQVHSVAQRLQLAEVSKLAFTSASLKQSQLHQLDEFFNHTQASLSFLSTPGFRSYAPKSGEIVGILKQMSTDFANNLRAARLSETKSKNDFEELKLAKGSQITSAQDVVAELKKSLADLAEAKVHAETTLENTKSELEDNTALVTKLKQECSTSEDRYQTRLKIQNEELSAVEDAIRVLNSDEAFDVFDRTVNSFLQLRAFKHSEDDMLRVRLTTYLGRIAKVAGSPAVALLAASAKIDAFTQVKQEIDKLIAEMLAQQQDESSHRDFCLHEIMSNNKATEEANLTKTSLTTKLDDLGNHMDQLGTDITNTKLAFAKLEDQMKQASELRKAERAANEQSIADQRLAQIVLSKAIHGLRRFYEVQQLSESASAAQLSAASLHHGGTRGPKHVDTYSPHAKGQKVIRLLEVILEDSQKAEHELVNDEKASQEAYSSFEQICNTSKVQYRESILGFQKSLATAKTTQSQVKGDLSVTLEKIADLSGTADALHKSCDFLVEHFEVRQQALGAEIEALRNAKKILAGTLSEPVMS